MTPYRIYVRPYFAEQAATRTAPDDLVYVLADQSEKETMMATPMEDVLLEENGKLEAKIFALRSALRALLAFDEDAIHPDNREWRRAVKAAEKVLGE